PFDRIVEQYPQDFFDNAIKWAGQHVRLSVRGQDNHIVFSVEDDGPGICPKKRSFVLQPGSRLDTSEAGNGLGLAIVSDLCAAYGGAFELETSEVLGGLEARCTLPRRRLAA
ncbi:MAG: ATP-binding protein, partial [Pseudomonadota bacterium]